MTSGRLKVPSAANDMWCRSSIRKTDLLRLLKAGCLLALSNFDFEEPQNDSSALVLFNHDRIIDGQGTVFQSQSRLVKISHCFHSAVALIMPISGRVNGAPHVVSPQLRVSLVAHHIVVAPKRLLHRWSLG